VASPANITRQELLKYRTFSTVGSNCTSPAVIIRSEALQTPELSKIAAIQTVTGQLSSRRRCFSIKGGLGVIRHPARNFAQQHNCLLEEIVSEKSRSPDKRQAILLQMLFQEFDRFLSDTLKGHP
jgi:hypothetical protein